MISSLYTDKLKQGYYTQTGTVLQRRDSSGQGQSLLLFLRDMGPLWVNAPSSSTKSRFGGATEPLVWGEFNLYQSPNKLYLQGAEIKEDFLSLRNSNEQLMTALRFYKRLSRVLMVGHESNQILTLLWGSLVLLKDNCPGDVVDFRFTWKLLNLIGLAPSLNQCVRCGERLESRVSWCSDGLICVRCLSGQYGKELEPGTLICMQAAALLDHNKFIEWSCSQRNNEIFLKQVKKLITFFSDID